MGYTFHKVTVVCKASRHNSLRDETDNARFMELAKRIEDLTDEYEDIVIDVDRTMDY